MCPLGEKMAKIWLKLQENGEKKSQMAKVMAKEKYILARTLLSTLSVVSFSIGFCLAYLSCILFIVRTYIFTHLRNETLFNTARYNH